MTDTPDPPPDPRRRRPRPGRRRERAGLRRAAEGAAPGAVGRGEGPGRQGHRLYPDPGSAKGRFVQTDARGTQTQGDFYLQRPGKARFAYDGPKGLLVVSNGNAVNIFDSRLKTFESYPLSRTPLVLLLAREVRLDRGVTITGVRKLSDGFTITAVDAKRQTLGRIALDFSNAPALLGWTVTDVKGGETRVRLVDFEKTSGLDPKLFVLTDPRRRVGKP
jgi:outer membrane lipoprotein-sorting protein